jgi:hypothetical protein
LSRPSRRPWRKPDLFGKTNPAKQAAAQQRYRQALTERLVAPLVEAAEAAVDPVETYQRLLLAQLIDLSNAKIVQARRLTEQAISGNGDPSDRRKDNSIQDLMALKKEITNLARSIRNSGRQR